MEWEGALPIIIVLAGFFIYIVVTFSQVVYELVAGVLSFFVGINRNNNPNRLSSNHATVTSLLEKFSYYKELSRDGKKEFSKRTVLFLANKKMIGMEGLTITDEMRILIGAAATQLTWGLEKHMILHFHTICVYPSTFYSIHAGAQLRGGVTPKGNLMFSWMDFKEGYATADDRLNLGLHEMAHALLLDMLYGSVPNQHLESEIGNWERTGDPVLKQLKAKSDRLLRNYGARNEHEFFAVCVENFFESPREFKDRMPSVYLSLSRLLNQDPLNQREDYRLYR